jgi:enterochelin esterase-like enzyme
MSDANTAQQSYFNDIIENHNIEDFFFNELIPYVEQNYRVRSESRFRYVACLSMDGRGTLIYSLLKLKYIIAARSKVLCLKTI